MEDGSAMVMVNGRRWSLDPRCLLPAPGEQPEGELLHHVILCTLIYFYRELHMCKVS